MAPPTRHGKSLCYAVLPAKVEGSNDSDEQVDCDHTCVIAISR